MEPAVSATGSGPPSLGARSSLASYSSDVVDVDDFRQPEAFWPCEFTNLQDQTWRQVIARLVDSTLFEGFVITCIVLDLALTVTLISMPDDEVAEAVELSTLSGVLLCVLLFDVCLRVLKDGLRFFQKPLNFLEFGVALAGCSLLLVQATTGYGSGAEKTTSMGRTLRPMLKASRILRMSARVYRGHAALRQSADRITKKIMMRRLDKFLSMPPTNVDVRPSYGYCHLEKVQVRSKAFANLHLPFTVCAGILDMLHIEVSSMRPERAKRQTSWTSLFTESCCLRRRRNKGNRLLVIVENVLLVIGPGHHEELSAPPWTFEQVLDRKTELVDLLARLVPSKPKKPGKSLGLTQRIKRKAIARFEAILEKGVKVSIRNVELRFEDALHNSFPPQWPLGFGGPGGPSGVPAVTAGFRVGSLQLRTEGSRSQEGEDADFRAQGVWRSALEGPTCASDRASRAEPKTQLSARDFDRDKAGAAERGRRSRKRLGLRVMAVLQQVCAFWDIEERPELDGAGRRYAERLREDHHGIPSFLRLQAKRHQRERVMLAVCGEVERRLHEAESKRHMMLRELWAARRWRPPLRARQQQDATGCRVHERTRRLRTMVSEHSYVLLPCDFSMHIFDRPRAPGAPSFDLSVDIPPMSIACDVGQAVGMVRALSYFKRWVLADRRFMWKPPPVLYGGATPTMRWRFAVQQVLIGLDPDRRWKWLDWANMRRRAPLHAEYLAMLSGDGAARDEARLSVIQVALPLASIWQIRKRAAFIRADRSRERRSRRWFRWRSGDGAETSKMSAAALASADSQDSISLEVADVWADDSMPTAFDPPSEDISGRLSTFSQASDSSGGAMNRTWQMHVRVEAVRAALLCSPSGLAWQTGRKPMLSSFAKEISLLGVFGAPSPLWLRLTPPKAAILVASSFGHETSWCSEAESPSIMQCSAELTVQDARAIFCKAPPHASWLRPLFSCGGSSGATSVQVPMTAIQGRPRQTVCGDDSGDGSDPQPALCVRMALLQSNEETFGGAERHLHIAAYTSNVDARVCSSLLRSLKRTLKAPLESSGRGRRHKCDMAAKSTVSTKSMLRSLVKKYDPVSEGALGTLFDSWKTSFSQGMTSRWTAKATTIAPTVMVSEEMPEKAIDMDSFMKEARDAYQRSNFGQNRVQRLHRYEKMIGVAGPFQGVVLSAKMLMLGGARATTVEPYTSDKWLCRCVLLPTGMAWLSKGTGTGIRSGFSALQPATGAAQGSDLCKTCGASGAAPIDGACRRGGAVRGQDGWWFESADEESRYRRATDHLMGRVGELVGHTKAIGSGRSFSSQGFDDTCAGIDAQEWGECPEDGEGRAPPVGESWLAAHRMPPSHQGLGSTEDTSAEPAGDVAQEAGCASGTECSASEAAPQTAPSPATCHASTSPLGACSADRQILGLGTGGFVGVEQRRALAKENGSTSSASPTATRLPRKTPYACAEPCTSNSKEVLPKQMCECALPEGGQARLTRECENPRTVARRPPEAVLRPSPWSKKSKEDTFPTDSEAEGIATVGAEVEVRLEVIRCGVLGMPSPSKAEASWAAAGLVRRPPKGFRSEAT